MDVNWYAAETKSRRHFTLGGPRPKWPAWQQPRGRIERVEASVPPSSSSAARSLANLARLCPSRPRREARRDDEPVALTRHRILVRPGASSPVIASMSTRATIRTESPVGGRLRRVGGWLRMAHAR